MSNEQQQVKRKFDNTRFVGTNMNQLKQQDVEVSRQIGDIGKTYAGYHTIQDGDNFFRIYPHHNAVRQMCGEAIPEDDHGETFAENKVVYYLPMMVQEKDDKGNLKFDARNQPMMKKIQKAVFDSRIHGGTPMDIVDEYIKFVNKWAKENIQDETKRTEFLLPLEGNFQKKIQGLKAVPSWIVYADQIIPKGKGSVGTEQVYDRKFARLEFGKAVRWGLDTLAAQESGTQPLGTDPYTNPEEGLAIIITYNKASNDPKGKYIVGQYAPKLPGGRYVQFPLDDNSLDNLLKHDSLYKQYKNVYRRRDFNLALEGLAMFDSENNFNLFNEDEFATVLGEIDSYYAEEDETKKTDEPAEGAAEANTTDTPAADEHQEPEADQFDVMTREDLKKWLKDNKTGFVVLPKHTIEFLKETCRIFVAGGTPATEVKQTQPVKQTTPVAGAQNNGATGDTRTPSQIAKDKLRELQEKNKKK